MHLIRTHVQLPNQTFFTVNGNLFQQPQWPVLLQMLSGAVEPGQLMPKDSILYVERNKLVEVTIFGTNMSLAGPVEFISYFNTLRYG